MDNLERVITKLQQGGVIAYPTEGVFGVGCDPDNPTAIESLLAVKQRSQEKGLILIAADYAQLASYIDETQLSAEQLATVLATWPGPYTWIMPASAKVSPWVSGQFDTVAVRVSDHPLVQQLCRQYGKPITSTSANLSGMPACKTSQEVEQQLGSSAISILYGETGGRANPTEIRDARTHQTLRQG